MCFQGKNSSVANLRPVPQAHLQFASNLLLTSLCFSVLETYNFSSPRLDSRRFKTFALETFYLFFQSRFDPQVSAFDYCRLANIKRLGNSERVLF